mgnify:FL=1
MVEFFKGVVTAVVAWILAVYTSYTDAFLTLFVGFTLNILLGVGADVNINKKAFSLRKATDALLLLLFYFMLIIFIHVALGRRYVDLANTMITWLTYIVGYFYLTNIFRNAKILFPTSKSIKFIYSFLSTEVMYKLKAYLGFHKYKNNNNNDIGEGLQ